ncbi:IS3 family transposase [Paenibacillus sp. BJ-4]
MKFALQEAGYLVNHKKVWRLMKELSISLAIRKKRNRLVTPLSSSSPIG